MNNYIIISHGEVTVPIKDIFYRSRHVLPKKHTYHMSELENYYQDYSKLVYKGVSKENGIDDFGLTTINGDKHTNLDEFCNKQGSYPIKFKNPGKINIIRYTTLYDKIYNNMLINDVNYAKGIYMSRIVSLTELHNAFNAFGHLFHESAKDMYYHSNSYKFYNMETLTIHDVEDIELESIASDRYTQFIEKYKDIDKPYNIDIKPRLVPKESNDKRVSFNMHINNNILY